MSRPIRFYVTTFVIPGTEHTVQLETCGVTQCAAKNVGWLLLSRHVRQYPTLPQDGWQLISHETNHARTQSVGH